MDSSIVPDSVKLSFSGRIGGFRPSSGVQISMWIFGHRRTDRDDGLLLARQLLSNDVDGPLGFPAAVVTFDIPYTKKVPGGTPCFAPALYVYNIWDERY